MLVDLVYVCPLLPLCFLLPIHWKMTFRGLMSFWTNDQYNDQSRQKTAENQKYSHVRSTLIETTITLYWNKSYNTSFYLIHLSQNISCIHHRMKINDYSSMSWAFNYGHLTILNKGRRKIIWILLRYMYNIWDRAWVVL